jgi:short subunit dehydrogenase-like uncharacterized protein
VAVRLISVVGAYGSTGEVVARTLAAQGGGALRLIGRNEAKLRSVARSLGGDVDVAPMSWTTPR